MITKKEQSLLEVLEYTGLTTLPKKFDPEKGKKVWVDAILEVRKVDGSSSYAYAKNVYGKKPRYIKVWGNSAAIVEVLSIHPVSFLSKEFMPVMANRKDVVNFVARMFGASTEKVASYSDEDLKTLAYSAAIKNQQMVLAQGGKDKYVLENQMSYEEATNKSKTEQAVQGTDVGNSEDVDRQPQVRKDAERAVEA